jgi:ATP-dependent protease ClpP protease subunit
MLNKVILILVAAFASATCAAPNVLNVNPKRLVKIIDRVDYSIIDSAIDLEKLAPAIADSKPDIFLMVNSPGGMVTPGLIFTNSIDRVKARGYKVKCFSTVIAASMAFQILAHCSDVYVLNNTKLLFHPVRISTEEGFTQDDLAYYLEEIRVVEAAMNKRLQQSFKLEQKLFAYHYQRETMWEAADLAYLTKHLTLVDDILGVEESYQYRKQRLFMFGQKHSQDSGLEYISPSILKIFYNTDDDNK